MRTQLAAVILGALAIAMPVSAQVDQKIVLTRDVVTRLLTGLKAGQSERERAEKEDTPYGRYQRAQAAHTAAKSKCEAAQQAFGARMAGDEKLMAKYGKLQEKQLAALEKGDQKAATAYQDQMLAMADSSCIVKEPQRPDAYYEAQRAIDTQAQAAVARASDFSPGELAMIEERATAILLGATAADVSPSEKSAVLAKAAELKPLLGIQDQPAHAAKPPSAPAPAPDAAPAPQISADASAMNACMMKNIQNHQAELEALGKRMQAAQQRNDTPKLMAMADTLQRIQMAGCQGQ